MRRVKYALSRHGTRYLAGSSIMGHADGTVSYTAGQGNQPASNTSAKPKSQSTSVSSGYNSNR